MIVGLSKEINKDYGQIIAIEYKSNVLNNPLSILRHWADKKNEILIQYGYVLSINPILKKKNFWTIVNRYKNQIEEVVFEYSMPNLFNTGDSLEKELNSLKESTNTSHAKLIFSNKAGSLNLQEENTLLKQSTEYIDKGGGEFKIKRKGEKSYIMSANKIKTQKYEIEGLNIETSDKKSFEKTLKDILGFEQ